MPFLNLNNSKEGPAMTRNEIFRKMISWAERERLSKSSLTVIQFTRFLPDGCTADLVELSPDILTPKGRLRAPIRRAIDNIIKNQNDFTIQEILASDFSPDADHPLYRYDARSPGHFGRLFFDFSDF
jgi:hypothetical protein